jgi:hypothetical protein
MFDLDTGEVFTRKKPFGQGVFPKPKQEQKRVIGIPNTAA